MNPIINCILLLYNLNPNLRTAFWLYIIFWAGVIGFGIYLGIKLPLIGDVKEPPSPPLTPEEQARQFLEMDKEVEERHKAFMEALEKIKKEECKASSTASSYHPE